MKRILARSGRCIVCGNRSSSTCPLHLHMLISRDCRMRAAAAASARRYDGFLQLMTYPPRGLATARDAQTDCPLKQQQPELCCLLQHFWFQARSVCYFQQSKLHSCCTVTVLLMAATCALSPQSRSDIQLPTLLVTSCWLSTCTCRLAVIDSRRADWLQGCHAAAAAADRAAVAAH